MEVYQKLKDVVATKYRSYGDKISLVTLGIGEKNEYTGIELANEIENQTEFGQKLVHNLVLLSLDLVTRGEEQITDKEPITAKEFLVSKGVLSVKQQKGIYEIQQWLTEFREIIKNPLK